MLGAVQNNLLKLYDYLQEIVLGWMEGVALKVDGWSAVHFHGAL